MKIFPFCIIIMLMFFSVVTVVFAETLLISDINYIDVVKGEIKYNYDIEIDGSFISEIAKHNPTAKADSVINLSGFYLIPGLIESHSHTYPGKSEESYRNALRWGITSIRDMAGDGSYLKELQVAIREEDLAYPDIYFSAVMAGYNYLKTSKKAISATPPQYKIGDAPWIRAVSDDSDFHQILIDAKNCGATGIKLYEDLSYESIQALCEEALKIDMKIWSHAFVMPATVEEVVSCQINTISHAFMILMPDNWNLKEFNVLSIDETKVNPKRMSHIFNLMKKNNIYFDPTLLVYKQLIEAREQDETELKKKLQLMYNVTKEAYENGIKIVAGTDIFLPDNRMPHLFEELDIYTEEIEMSNIDVLRSATIHGAEVLGIEKYSGSIAIGKKADLIVLTKNPLRDIENIKQIHFILKNGTIINGGRND